MDFNTIIDWVVGLIEEVVSFIVQIAEVLYNLLVEVFNALVSVIVDVWNWLEGIWSTLKDFFDDLWWQVIVPFIEWCQQIIDDITTWLANFLDPIITWVQRILAFYQKYIYPILHNVLEVIQRMRVILGLLKLLGVKWAAKLDADLQVIQSYITAVIQEITATLNTITTVLGLMVDPTGILRRDFFTGTLFSSLGTVKAAGSWGTDRVSTPGELTQISQNNALVQGDLPLAKINPSGSLSYAPGMAAIDADVRAGYSADGVPVLGN